MSPAVAAKAENRKVTFWLWILGVVIVASFALSAYAVVQQNNASTVRAADRKAQATAQVARCFQQIKDGPTILQTLGLIDDLATNSIKGNRAALAAAKPDDPLNAIRQASLERLLPRRASLRRLIVRTEKNIPPKTACLKLAADLGVDPTKLNK